jgi:hypothetical protein
VKQQRQERERYEKMKEEKEYGGWEEGGFAWKSPVGADVCRVYGHMSKQATAKACLLFKIYVQISRNCKQLHSLRELSYTHL